MIICKICNPNLKGNGYCQKHSTSGTNYLDSRTEKKRKNQPKGITTNSEDDWEKDYELFGNYVIGTKPIKHFSEDPLFQEIKSFIRQLLAQQHEKLSKEMANAILMAKEGWIEEGRREIIEEIEKMKEKVRCAACDGAKCEHTQRCQSLSQLLKETN